MKAQEIELWAREKIDAVRSNQPVEDSRVELKASWIDPDKAAPRLAAHANSARGEAILWIIGVDETKQALTNVEPRELTNWYTAIQKCFDGFAPALLDSVNFRVDDSTVVALYFDTEHGAPYVIKYGKAGGGYPQFVVPWREGTGLRAARREDLLRILVPIRRLSSLINELDFNLAIARKCAASTSPDTSWGALFHDSEFNKAVGDGAFAEIIYDVRRLVYDAYIAMGRANQVISGALNTPLTGSQRGSLFNTARTEVINSLAPIEAAYKSLSGSLQK